MLDFSKIPKPKLSDSLAWWPYAAFNPEKSYCKVLWHYCSDNPIFDQDHESYEEMLEGETEEDVLKRWRKNTEEMEFCKNVKIIKVEKCDPPEYIYSYHYGCNPRI